MIGDYLTTTPGVNIAGNCVIGDNVYIGMNSAIKEKITIKSNTKIGLNSGIIKDINEEGLYFGCPAKQIKYAKSN